VDKDMKEIYLKATMPKMFKEIKEASLVGGYRQSTQTMGYACLSWY